MKLISKILSVVMCFLWLTALAGANVFAVESSLPAVIPVPEKVELGQGTFQLQPAIVIRSDIAGRETADYLSSRLSQATGFTIKTVLATEAPATPAEILLTTKDARAGLGVEGYELVVTTNEVVIRAPGPAGLFYGVQTLLQLIPPEVFAARPVTGINWRIPCVQIEDQPRFKWRGLMLDVSRHFFNKAEVEQLLDAMALLKLNVFHWHLTDVTGWRIEIKKFPRLTTEGAWRKDIGFGMNPTVSTAYGPDGRYGGYYSQPDIREIVAYAAARHITIIPEIEMPGHSTAALNVYPELSCSGKGGVPVYCAGNDATFAFLQSVLDEVFELFPGQYIHIGGDEVPQKYWQTCAKCQARIQQEGLHDEKELQSYFIKRIAAYISAHGRTMVGWSEIRQGGMATNAVLMDWIGGGAEAAAAGHDVVMTPGDYCYFDHYQSLDYTTEPVAIGCYMPLHQVYVFEPVPTGLAPEYRSHVLGAQGNVWTEYIASADYLQYMTFPRACALAEAVWSPAPARDWEDFNRRLPFLFQRLDIMKIKYRRDNAHKLGEWGPPHFTASDGLLQWDVTSIVTKPDGGHLILNDDFRPLTKKLLAEPGKCHVVFEHNHGAPMKISRVDLLENNRIIASDIHAGLAAPNPRDLIARDVVYILSLPAGQAGAHYTVQAHTTSGTETNSFGSVYFELRPAR